MSGFWAWLKTLGRGGDAGPADGGAGPAVSDFSPYREGAKHDIPVTAVGEVRVTATLLARLGARDAALWAPVLDAACRRFGITTKRRVAMFLANVLHETGRLTRWEESLDYSVTALLSTFGRHRISAEDAQRLGRKVGQGALSRAQQDAIADIIYGGDWGRVNLGNVEPHDGSLFKGRGCIQATGRAMYRKLAAIFGLRDELAVRDWLLTREGAALSAAWIWAEDKRCNPLADAGDVAGARRKVNGGSIGLDDVTALNARALALL